MFYIIEKGGQNLYNSSFAAHLIKPKGRNDLTIGFLGQLGFKEEPAGKLRVFAMVDFLTQTLLRPLHLFLFDIFKEMPNDGTHDQDRAFQRALRLSKKYGGSFGYDLSAATDRLPLSIQSEILNVIFSNKLGDIWAKLLVERDYQIPPNDYKIAVGSIRYSVGQPMGALSSWAMLNLTHHLMVQYCYRLAKGIKLSSC